LALCATVLLVGPAHALTEAQFQEASAQFSLAQGGETAAIDRAADTFATLSRGEPSNPVLLAYAGAANAQRANTTLFPWKKMGYAEDGLAMIDKALTLLTPTLDVPLYSGVPAVLNVHFVAANTFLAVPKFMNRAAQGQKLLGNVLGSPLFAQAPLGFQGAVWLRAANLAETEHRVEDARKYLHLVINAKAPQAQAARAQLQVLAP